MENVRKIEIVRGMESVRKTESVRKMKSVRKIEIVRKMESVRKTESLRKMESVRKVESVLGLTCAWITNTAETRGPCAGPWPIKRAFEGKAIMGTLKSGNGEQVEIRGM